MGLHEQSQQQQNPIARMISEALSRAKGIPGEIASQIGEKGLPGFLLQGQFGTPLEQFGGPGKVADFLDPTEGNQIVGGLNDLPGRIGMDAVRLLGGQRGVDFTQNTIRALGGSGVGTETVGNASNMSIDPQLVSGQNQTIDPALEALVAASGGGGGAPQAAPPQQPFNAADFLPPEGTPAQPPNFDAARQALGPAPEAQQVGKAESLQRLFGGQAGGGLGAIQNLAGSGRAASLGEVIAGVGAGGGAAAAATGAENRQFQQVQQEQEFRRNAELSRIEQQEEAAAASTDQFNIQQFQRQSELKAMMGFQVAIKNYEATLPIMGAGGYWDQQAGKFIPTAQTHETIIKNLSATRELLLGPASRNGEFAGHQMMRTGLLPGEQLPFDVGSLAGRRADVMNLVADKMNELGYHELAENVLEIGEGSQVLLGDADFQDLITGRFLVTILGMVMEELTALQSGVTGEQLPYGGIFNEEIAIIYGGPGTLNTTEGLLRAISEAGG